MFGDSNKPIPNQESHWVTFSRIGGPNWIPDFVTYNIAFIIKRIEYLRFLPQILRLRLFFITAHWESVISVGYIGGKFMRQKHKFTTDSHSP